MAGIMADSYLLPEPVSVADWTRSAGPQSQGEAARIRCPGLRLTIEIWG